MTRKPKNVRSTPIGKDATLAGASSLFDALEVDDAPEVEITDQEKASFFLSHYMSDVDPIVRYERYFEDSVKDVDLIFHDVKLYYTKLVLNGTWDEAKYVRVLDRVFTTNKPLNVYTFDTFGRLYDNGSMDPGKRKVVRRRTNG